MSEHTQGAVMDPEFTDNSSRPEDGDQSSLVQDPSVAYDAEGNVIQ